MDQNRVTPLFVRKPQMAEMLSISVRTLEKWIATRKVRTIRAGGVVLFDPQAVFEDVKAFELSSVSRSDKRPGEASR